MGNLTLYLGNKNYSSWSMRAWLAMRTAGAPFEEHVFHLGEPGVRDQVRRVSPTGRVPALNSGQVVLWDSLAIMEYLAERFPEAGLWPAEPEARAVARAAVAEMHSGFPALRRHMPVNVRRECPGKGREKGVEQDIDRVLEIWRNCRAGYGQGGDFLFGDWSLADCAYAPVVSRFVTYAVNVDGVSREYMDAVLAWPAMQEWVGAARAEMTTVDEFDL
jgi:glutathione S-transferase